jgi:deoxyribonuclease-4
MAKRVPRPPLIGAHLSIAGGHVNALHEARRLKLECVQVFTKNQRQWRVSPLDPKQQGDWLEMLSALGWREGRPRTVSHNSYLINLASPDKALWMRSIAMQRIELERCEALEIPFLVAHPGAHLGPAPPAGQPHQLGAPASRSERAGLRRIARALDRLHRELPGYRTITCLETTAGAGSTLGYDFQQLAMLRDEVREPERIGFAFDTCHVTAAGYDMSSDARARAVLDDWHRVCGADTLRVFHLNDSIGAVGSRRDRHTHIGEGTCGRSCFGAIMNRSEFADVPKILETPKGSTPKGTPWDLVNVRRLKRLARPPGRSR